MDWSQFEKYVETLMRKEHIPGAAVAVSKAGHIVYKSGFGFRDLEDKKPVTPETIFGTASVTKSFTALAVLQLEENGKLTVQDPVVKHIPELQINGMEDIRELKIHHLMSHTTGLPPIRRREELHRLNDHLKYLASESYELFGKPGEYFSYSNDAFLLLGLIIERVTGRLYRKFVTEEILALLGMHRSTFSLEELARFDNVTVPYDIDRKTNEHKKVKWPKLGNYEVGGGIRSSVLDLLKYGQIFIGKIESMNRYKTVKQMWEPVHQIGRNQFYGYGLKVTPDYSGLTLAEHPGGQPGVSSNFGFIPEKNLVVAVLTNAGGVPAGDIWLAAVNTALGLPIDHKRSVEPHFDATSKQLEKFTGTYSSAEGSKITVFLEDGEPKVEVEDECFTLRASDEQTLVLDRYSMRIRFLFKVGSKEPWAAFFGSRILCKKV